jgi:hypothetical protein
VYISKSPLRYFNEWMQGQIGILLSRIHLENSNRKYDISATPIKVTGEWKKYKESLSIGVIDQSMRFASRVKLVENHSKPGLKRN